MSLRNIIIFLCFITLAAPFSARANILFSEIMYDFPGAELSGDHDWVEVINNGSAPVDISAFKFFESTTNHGLKLDRGSATIGPGSFAVIANATSTFLSDWPNFSGTLFDSSFNLNSAGEPLKLCSASCAQDGSNLEDSLSYVPLENATDKGDSLQKDSSGGWIAALPTTGTGLTPAASSAADVPASSPSPDSNSAVSSEPSVALNTKWSVEPQVFADAGKDRTVVVGAGAVFEGKALGLKKEPLQNARYIWNFGDGATGEGKMVEHTYRHPGDYLVVMEAASGYYSGEDQLKVRAEPSPLSVSSITNSSEYFVELANSSNTNIDISMWGLALDGKVFAIPKNTFVMAGKKLIFPNEVTGLLVGEGSLPELHYPNGTLASRFGETRNKVVEISVAESPDTGQPSVPLANVSAKGGVKVAVAEEKDLAGGNLAAAAESSPKKSSVNYIWLFGVAGISIAAIAGVFLARKLEQPNDESQKIADEIEIIEG